MIKQKKSDVKGSGCFGHVNHNAASKAADELSMDFEAFILKVFAHFNGQTKRHAELKEWCEFFEVDYLKPVRHSIIRWLSLEPSIERSLKLWPVLKDMFTGDDRPPKFIRDFVSSKKGYATGLFLSSTLKEFNRATMILEV